MRPFEISKNIKFGDLCTFRKDKLIKASKKSKIAGIWVLSNHTIIYTLDGVRYDQTTPTGLQIHGYSKANIRRE